MIYVIFKEIHWSMLVNDEEDFLVFLNLELWFCFRIMLEIIVLIRLKDKKMRVSGTLRIFVHFMGNWKM